MSSPAFDRLIRFQTSDGNVKYGNLEKETPAREIEGTEVEVLEGDVKSGFKKTGGKAKVGKLLSPLKREELNIILCVGLNYRKHAEECNVIVSFPIIYNYILTIAAPNTREPSHFHEAQRRPYRPPGRRPHPQRLPIHA
jgi:2-keto-4-pentenoate hydratase/2-oxohepta-3-ene-1,7-dioic acid hydratase in catechol pathway